MKLNIYDSRLNRLRFLDRNFISCLWRENYNSQGSFSLEVAATDLTKEIIRPDYYVGRTDRPVLMVIKSVTVKGTTITATGNTADRQLTDVAFIGTISANSSVPAAIKTAYSGSNGYKSFVISDSDITAKYTQQISNKSIYELLTTMCQGADLGYRAIKKGQNIAIEFYQPRADSNLKFSAEYGNIRDLSLSLSTQPYKNYAIVLGRGEDNDRMRVEVDIRTDSTEQRRDLIVDARDLQVEDGESEDSYRARLTARGIEKLLDKRQMRETDFTPLADDFGAVYDLGDVITVLMRDLGIRLQSRVVSFQEKVQNNKSEKSVEVGQITSISTSSSSSRGGNGASLQNTYLLQGGAEIPANDNINNYLEVGNYYCPANATAATLSNCPTQMAFSLKVYDNVGLGTGSWRYRKQRIDDLDLNSWQRTASTSDAGKNWNWGQWKKESTFIDQIYPVGSIYMSANSTSPATLFGGTWEQIQGRFLLGQSSSYAAGSTGGEETHKLSIAEMPQHGHPVYVWDQAGTLGQAYWYNGATKQLQTSGRLYNESASSWQTTADGLQAAGSGRGDPSGGTALVGSTTAHNNMPPYLAVYIWKRTA